MPIVHIDFKEGRTLDQKRELVSKITDAFVSTIGSKPEAVQIIIREFTDDNFSKGGKLNVDK